MSITSTILLITGLLLANAFFVAAEFAFVSSRRDRIDSLLAQGRTAARKVLYGMEHLSLILAAAQFGITICSLVLGKVAEPAVAHFIEEPFTALGVPPDLLHPISFVIALGLITFLHILFGEMVPKNIALAGPETLAMWLAPAMILWLRVTGPFIRFLNWIARITLRMFGIEQQDELDSSVTQAQLSTMIQDSRSEGLLDAEEHDRLRRALASDSRTVREVMIPEHKVTTLEYSPAGPTIGELTAALTRTGFSRFPVVGRQDRLLGYVHFKDVLHRMSHAEASERIPRTQIRPMFVVDADTTLDAALHRMHVRSAHLAQVHDRGHFIGVVFLEDLIEEYIGTVRDATHEA